MLTNEVLHKAKNFDDDFLLLKLDTVKDFDYMGCYYIFALLEKVGVRPGFLQVIKATYINASSTILLQG